MVYVCRYDCLHRYIRLVLVFIDVFPSFVDTWNFECLLTTRSGEQQVTVCTWEKGKLGKLRSGIRAWNVHNAAKHTLHCL